MQDKVVSQLRKKAVKPDWPKFGALVQQAARGDSAAQLEVCAALIWCAFAAPQAIVPIYDVVSSVYLDDVSLGDAGITELTVPEVALPDSFWQAFAKTLSGPVGGYDALSITATVAALGGSLDPAFHQVAEQAARQHASGVTAEAKSIPPLLQLTEIESCDPGSLGHSLYRMLVDNGYDAEVLDRDAIGLANLEPAIRYLNTRILQMHDVWHLVAGYQTTSLHEIAISSFQLAQFGHNYSAMFLATVATMSQSNSPEAFNLMMTIFSESWRHGRQTPSFMPINFEAEWNTPITEIRQRYRIEPFQGSFPADLFEQLKAAG